MKDFKLIKSLCAKFLKMFSNIFSRKISQEKIRQEIF